MNFTIHIIYIINVCLVWMRVQNDNQIHQIVILSKTRIRSNETLIILPVGY